MTSSRKPDVFLLPCEDGYILYAPLAARALHTNAQCAAQLQRYLETGNATAVDSEIVHRLGGLHWLHTSTVPVSLPIDRLYHPTRVTLFLTNRCNLRCEYCYAQAGELDPLEMTPRIYQAAIHFITRNAKRAGRPVHVSFHGGGEPTMAWEALTGAIDYARHYCLEKNQCQVYFALATNGVMSPSRRRFVASRFTHVTLSLDGPPEIQDQQRPTTSGKGSFSHVKAFISVLKEHDTLFGIRSTITNRNVRHMTEMLDFFLDETGCKDLHFEPFYPHGRGADVPEQVPDPELFAGEFIRAMDRARERGANLRFSTTRLPEPQLVFCGCANDAFNVTPEGHLTACFEVCHPHDPLWNKYCFGQLDAEQDRFVIDMDRLKTLRQITVDQRPRCTQCFARWSCSGDCPAKSDRGLESPDKNPVRCQITQSILHAILERAVTRKHEGKAYEH